MSSAAMGECFSHFLVIPALFPTGEGGNTEPRDFVFRLPLFPIKFDREERELTKRARLLYSHKHHEASEGPVATEKTHDDV